MQKSGETVEFVYNENGLRVQKTVNGVVTDYTLHGKNVVHMKQGSDELHFFYDAQNKPAVVVYNGTPYSYVKNLQGDIVAILDAAGTVVVSYVYDAWGRPISKTGSMASTLGTIQPFRYRSYVFDEESGLYYLRSRYYAPSIGRLISPDIVFTKPQVVNGHNLYAYCNNQPCNRIDPYGQSWISALLFISLCACLLTGCSAKTNYGAASPYTPTDSKNFNCYAYVLGETEWKYVGGSHNAVTDFNVEIVAQMVLDDAEADGRTMKIIDSYNSPIDENQYRIALRTSANDYHFMVQHDDGTWSHKPGFCASRLIEGTNPSNVSWDAPILDGFAAQFGVIIEIGAEENYYNSKTIYFAVTK